MIGETPVDFNKGRSLKTLMIGETPVDFNKGAEFKKH